MLKYQKVSCWLITMILVGGACFLVAIHQASAGCGNYMSGPEVLPDDSSSWYVCKCVNGDFESYKTKRSLEMTCAEYCRCSNSKIVDDEETDVIEGMQYCTEHPRSSESFYYFCYCKLRDDSIRFSSYTTDTKCNCVCNTLCASKNGTRVQGSCTAEGPTGLGNACGGYGDICNPVGINSVAVMIGKIIRTLMGIIGSIALVMFVWAGFIWMTARGNKEKAQQSLHIMVWTALGLAIIFASYVVLRFVFNIFDILP